MENALDWQPACGLLAFVNTVGCGPPPPAPDMNSNSLIALLAAAAAGLLAGLVAIMKRPPERRTTAHWAFALGLLLLAGESAVNALAAAATRPAAIVTWHAVRMLVESFLPGVWLYFSFCYARGNSGEFLSRWRTLVVAVLVIPPGLALFTGTSGLAPRWEDGALVLGLTWSGATLQLLFLLSTLLILMNVERTFRSSVGMMRWRIKFMILGLGVLFGARAYTASQALLFHAVPGRLLGANGIALGLACLLMLRAVLRAGNLEANVYPSHALLHRSLTGLLASVYLIVVGVSARTVVVNLQWDANLTAFVVLVLLVLLTLVLLSDRVRLQTRRFVSRHFQRPLYDYRSVWRSFTLATAASTEPAEFCRAGVRLVAEVFQTLSVTIWLLDEKRERLELAASTVLTAGPPGAAALSPAEMAEMLQGVREHPEPLSLAHSKEPWFRALRRCYPEALADGGGAVCVPMLVGGEAVGFLTLGERVGGLAYSAQDFELLACVGDQIAAGVQSTQLASRLLQAREFEAFQAMSSFFVHDLKNTVSTLNLMLLNLPVHFDDPEFRADALRGIARTVEHTNRLIERLGMLRQGLQIQAVETDLALVVQTALARWQPPAGVTLQLELPPVPKLSCDADQLGKVLINLLMNAVEAMDAHGEIRLTTGTEGPWAVLRVTDTGCGMTPEFVRDSLFRPFHSTKKHGLGIGMFQSKMIVEAHGGRLAVQTAPGAGATFQIRLPLRPRKP